jgi:hypothetical protein
LLVFYYNNTIRSAWLLGKHARRKE